MILKIADYSLRNSHDGKKLIVHNKGTSTTRMIDDMSWWYYDGITRAKVSHYHNNSAAHIAYPEPNIMFTNVQYTKGCDCSGEVSVDGNITGCANCVRTAIVSCILEDGSDFVVMLDTRAYLLNDNGKTIDTIVCNYI